LKGRNWSIKRGAKGRTWGLKMGGEIRELLLQTALGNAPAGVLRGSKRMRKQGVRLGKGEEVQKL